MTAPNSLATSAPPLRGYFLNTNLSASRLELCQSSLAKEVLNGPPFYGGTNDTIRLGRSSDMDSAVTSARHCGPCGRCQCGGLSLGCGVHRPRSRHHRTDLLARCSSSWDGKPHHVGGDGSDPNILFAAQGKRQQK